MRKKTTSNKYAWMIAAALCLAALCLAAFLAGCLQRRAALAPGFPPMPKAVAPPPGTNLLYFAATATDAAGRTSEYSAELVYTNTARASCFQLLWNSSPCTNIITNYTVWQGRASHSYTNWVKAGTNLTATIWTAPPPKTNRVVTVTTINATNIQYSTRAGGPWLLAGKTNLCLTNPPGTALFYRPMGRTKASAARAYINVRAQ